MIIQFCRLVFSCRNREKIMMSGRTNLKLTGVMKLLIPSQHLPAKVSAVLSDLFITPYDLGHKLCKSTQRVE